MNKKQKKTLIRIIVSFVLIVVISILCKFVDINKYIQLAMYVLSLIHI